MIMKRECDRCGVVLTKENNKCGFCICDKCNADLEKKFEKHFGIESIANNAVSLTETAQRIQRLEIERAIVKELEGWYEIISNMDNKICPYVDHSYIQREKLFVEGKEEILDMLRNRIGELKDGRI